MNLLSKKQCLIIASFFIPILASSQSWFQEGDYWVYRYSDGFSGTDGYCEMQVAGDTIINGINAKILAVDCNTFSLQTNSPRKWNYEVFGTQIDNKVYFTNASNGMSEVYDFNIIEQDIYEYNLGAFQQGCSEFIEINLDSLRSFVFEEQEYQIQHGSYYDENFDYTFYNNVYERMGSLDALLFTPNITCLFDLPTFRLCKFKSSQDSISFLDQDCFEVLTATNDISQNKFQFGPNPTNQKITIFGEIIPEYIAIYDLNGQLLIKNLRTTELDVNTLTTGAFILMISSGDNKEFHKFIKY